MKIFDFKTNQLFGPFIFVFLYPHFSCTSLCYWFSEQKDRASTFYVGIPVIYIVTVENMRKNRLDVSHVIRQCFDMTLFLSGVILLIIGLLLKKDLGSWISTGTLFLGMVFSTFGIFLKLGIFSVKLRSLAGVGTILICASVVCFALSIVLFQFAELTIVGYHPVRGSNDYVITCIHLEHSYLWLCNLLAQASLWFIIGGVTARFLFIVLPLINLNIISNERPNAEF